MEISANDKYGIYYRTLSARQSALVLSTLFSPLSYIQTVLGTVSEYLVFVQKTKCFVFHFLLLLTFMYIKITKYYSISKEILHEIDVHKKLVRNE